MKVAQLIAALSALPGSADVTMLWDGAARSAVEGVWLAQSGDVVVGPLYEPIYSDEDRPVGAPTELADHYFSMSRASG